MTSAPTPGLVERLRKGVPYWTPPSAYMDRPNVSAADALMLEAAAKIEGLRKALEMKPGWSLEKGHRNRDEEDEYGWIVYEVRGGINDLEWTEIGFGETPLDALLAAHQSALSPSVSP